LILPQLGQASLLSRYAVTAFEWDFYPTTSPLPNHTFIPPLFSAFLYNGRFEFLQLQRSVT